MKSLAINTQMLQQKTKASIHNLKIQISQLASSVRSIEVNKGKLPFQAELTQQKMQVL